MGRWYRSLLVPEFSIWLFSWGELCLLLFLSRWLLISAGNLTGKVAFNYSFSLKNACDWLSKSSGDFCVTRQIICPSVESKLLTGWSDVILGPIVAFLEIFISDSILFARSLLGEPKVIMCYPPIMWLLPLTILLLKDWEAESGRILFETGLFLTFLLLIAAFDYLSWIKFFRLMFIEPFLSWNLRKFDDLEKVGGFLLVFVIVSLWDKITSSLRDGSGTLCIFCGRFNACRDFWKLLRTTDPRTWPLWRPVFSFSCN